MKSKDVKQAGHHLLGHPVRLFLDREQVDLAVVGVQVLRLDHHHRLDLELCADQCNEGGASTENPQTKKASGHGGTGASKGLCVR